MLIGVGPPPPTPPLAGEGSLVSTCRPVPRRLPSPARPGTLWVAVGGGAALRLVPRRTLRRAGAVLVQAAVEVQALQDELDAAGDAGRAGGQVELAERLAHAVQVAELMHVVHAGHVIGHVDA